MSDASGNFKSMKATTDWSLDDFARVHLEDDVEILMDTNGSKAIVLWPWFAAPDIVSAVTQRAKMMGFTTIIEAGNMEGWSIEDVDCDDFDYIMVESS